MASDGCQVASYSIVAVSHKGTLWLSGYRALLSVVLQDVKVESSLGSIGILNVPQCVLASVHESAAECLSQCCAQLPVQGVPEGRRDRT
jgi:hypothetical protein